MLGVFFIFIRIYNPKRRAIYMARELPKVYEPQQVESRIYDMWQQGGYFHAEVDESKKPLPSFS